MGDRALSKDWSAGNAAEDSASTRGWFVGEFISPTDDVRVSKDVEVKWMRHPVGDKRTEWTADDERTTLIILTSGRFRIDLTEGSSTMSSPGDYVIWSPGTSHAWEALEESIVTTVRWRSTD